MATCALWYKQVPKNNNYKKCTFSAFVRCRKLQMHSPTQIHPSTCACVIYATKVLGHGNDTMIRFTIICTSVLLPTTFPRGRQPCTAVAVEQVDIFSCQEDEVSVCVRVCVCVCVCVCLCVLRLHNSRIRNTVLLATVVIMYTRKVMSSWLQLHSQGPQGERKKSITHFYSHLSLCSPA